MTRGAAAGCTASSIAGTVAERGFRRSLILASPVVPHGGGSWPDRREVRAPLSGAWVGARDRFRADVEGLRAVAILAVLLYHAGLRPAAGGYVGVDAFYVVSGFLITGLVWDELRATGHVRVQAERAAVERAGGGYLDVSPWICTRSTCAVVLGNLLVYRDDDHLSTSYPAWLAPLVTLELQQTIGAPQPRAP
jgi:SGNH domain (fused to AT3 domains)